MTDPFSEDCIRLSGTSKTHSHLNDAFHSVSVRFMFAERMGEHVTTRLCAMDGFCAETTTHMP